MIRALLGELEQVTVTVEANYADRGTVDGSGSYYPGDTAILTATPAAGYRFAGWSTGEQDNPLHLRVTGPATIIAAFVPQPVGIEESELEGCRVELSGLNLTIDNPQGLTVSLYDMQGRQLVSSASRQASFTLPAAGVYMLQAGGKSHKIVAL